MKTRTFFLLSALTLAACNNAHADIRSFEECMQAGYPIMETYPRRCHVPGGPTFTETLIPPPSSSTGSTTFPED